LSNEEMVVVAQLVRASDCGSEGRGFETHHPPKKKRLIIKSLFLFQYFGCEFYQETALSPTIEAIRVEIKNTLQNVAGSLNTNIPIRTVPIAPIPVQTA